MIPGCGRAYESGGADAVHGRSNLPAHFGREVAEIWTADRRAVSTKHASRGASDQSKVPLFGARAYAKRQTDEPADALSENRRLREQLEQVGGLGIGDLQRLQALLGAQIAERQAVRDDLVEQVVDMREQHLLSGDRDLQIPASPVGLRRLP